MTKPESENKDQSFVDRRNNRGGIRDGGRRKSDTNAPVGSSRIWFGLSLLLTILIMVWTFAVPFRTNKPVFSFEEARPASYTPPVSADIQGHPEHGMSREDYIAHVMEIEAGLQEELAKKNAVPRNLPDAKHAKRKMREIRNRWQSELEELEALAKKTDEGEFDKNTVDGQRIESLRQRLSETDS